MSYMSFLRGDVIIEQYEMCKWRYLNSGGAARRGALSEIRDEQERLAANEEQNEAVKDIIENLNPYLMKYIKNYWEDYDSVQSNEAMNQSFHQLTERELNQLSQLQQQQEDAQEAEEAEWRNDSVDGNSMNEWMNDSMNEWMNDSMNEWFGYCKKKCRIGWALCETNTPTLSRNI